MPDHPDPPSPGPEGPRDETRGGRAGWWILPVVLGGAVGWALIFWLML